MRLSHVLLLVFNIVSICFSQMPFDDCLAEAGRDHDKAISDCSAAIESGHLTDYELVHSLNNRGWSYYRKGDYDQAIQDYSQAIHLKADYAFAFNNRGLAYAGKGDYDRAIDDYNRAIELKADYAAAVKNRGIAYFGKRDYHTAIQNFDQAIKLGPDAEVFYERGRAYSRERELNRAIGDFSRAVQLKPNYGDAFKERSEAFMYRHDDESALRDMNRVIELEPDDGDAISERGSMYYQKRDYERAIRDFSRAIQLKPDNVFNFLSRAAAYYDDGEYDAAIRDYNEVVKAEPEINIKNATEIHERGLAYLFKGDYEGAIRDFSEVADLNLSWGFYHRGLARFFQGDFAAAKQDFDRAGEGPREDIWMFLAEVRLGENAKDELREKAPRIHQQLKYWPGPVIQYYLGSSTATQVLVAARADDQADKNPCCDDSSPRKVHFHYSEGAAYFYLGQGMLLHGDSEQARNLFQKALSMALKNSEEYHGSILELKHLRAMASGKILPHNHANLGSTATVP